MNLGGGGGPSYSWRRASSLSAWGWLCRRLLRGEEALEGVRVELSFEHTSPPVLVCGGGQIVSSRFRGFDPHDEAVMGPAQKATQCVAFLPSG